jgi:hypothetical protein
MINPADSQLDTELQELYIINRHWVSDLEFFNNDLVILKKMLMRGEATDSLHSNSSVVLGIERLESASVELGTNIGSYLRLLEPLIKKTNTDYQLTIIETHSMLEQRMCNLLESFKEIKQDVFKRLQVG